MTRISARFKVLAIAFVLALPSLSYGGDSPILVVGNWGVGEIDGKILFYLGKGRCWDTPIPAPPHGPRWDVAYRVLPFVVAGGVTFRLYRRRHKQTMHRAGPPSH
ncbi:MAG: hypothetical protein JWN40_5338 [Phycisphaerales bacterium]|nr:hypothetical protein [Phycisphaerales bacterium]